MAIIAAYHFETDLWVEAELLGAEIALTRQERRVWLTLPAEDDSFGMRNGVERALGGYSGTVDQPRQRASVLVLQVKVEINASLTAEQVRQGDISLLEELSALLREGAGIAKSVVADLSLWVRTTKGQYWLEPASVAPRITWMTDVRDAAGDRIPTGYHDPFVVCAQSGPGLSRGDIEEVLGKAESETRPELAYELLADARYYASRANQPNPRIAVILAAISTEVRIKTFLTARANFAQAALVDLILSNPRDVSMAAVSLFDKALLAVLGRSYRHDHPEEYKALMRLFETRNRIAHRGAAQETGNESANDALTAAAAAFSYLDSLA